ncbi:hypothetical protein [Campylobacter helveticus]|uniref:hypothetical protein n=1 Tax=Campylobacter helveticus TaxID=28898 RepID=UPI001F102925|nr:hypothetical protein [Campylobacter helveticus]
MIAPWTKKEKAYYESLKTKRERYKYLVIRSGLRSAVIDILYEAYACYENKEKFKTYEYLFKEVEKNRGLAHLSDGYLFMAECTALKLNRVKLNFWLTADRRKV